MTYLYEPVYDQFGPVDEPVDWELWQMRQDSRNERDPNGFDPDFARDVREEQEDTVQRAWWFEPEHPEQTAWECLKAGGGHISVGEAGAVFDAMMSAMARGDRDAHPW